MAFDCKASDGNIWRFSVDDDGILNSEPSPDPNGYSSPPLADYSTGLMCYTLGAEAGDTGRIIADPAPFAPNFPTRITMISPGGYVWFLLINLVGQLQTIGGFIPECPETKLGLALGNMSYPAVVQPGGKGHIVTAPAQGSNEKIGRFSFGCSHSSNTIEVLKYPGCSVEPVALLVCPLCRYIQRIITPYNLIHTDPANSILQC